MSDAFDAEAFEKAVREQMRAEETAKDTTTVEPFQPAPDSLLGEGGVPEYDEAKFLQQLAQAAKEAATPVEYVGDPIAENLGFGPGGDPILENLAQPSEDPILQSTAPYRPDFDFEADALLSHTEGKRSPALTEQELWGAKDQQIKQALALAQQSGDLKKEALAVGLGERLGGAVTVDNYVEMSDALELVHYDPALLRQEYPEYYNALVNANELAHIMVRDEKVFRFAVRNKNWLTRISDMLMSATPVINMHESFARIGEVLGFEDIADMVSMARAATRIDFTFQEEKVAREFTPGKSPAAALREAVKHAVKQNWLSKQGVGLMAREGLDPDSRETLEARLDILRQKRELGVAKDYGFTNPLGRAILTGAEAYAQQFESIGAMGVAGAATLLSRNPVVGLAIARALNTGASLWTETGGAYIEYRGSVDAEGKPIEKWHAMAGATLYGLASATVEQVSFGTHTKSLQGFMSDVSKGKGRDWMLDFLADPFKRKNISTLAARLAVTSKNILTSGVSEGGEEYTQAMLQEGFKWLSSGMGDNVAGEFGWAEAHKKATDAAVMGFIGGIVGMGTVRQAFDQALFNRQHHSIVRDREMLEALFDAADGNTAIASDEMLARYLKNEMGRAGESLERIYVDPKAIQEVAQQLGIPLQDLLNDLLDAKSADSTPIERFQAALAERPEEAGGQATLGVSLREVLRNWPNKKAAKMLLQDVSFKGRITAREFMEINDKEQLRVRELLAAHEHGLDGVEDAGAEEMKVLRLLEAQTRRLNGTYTENEINQQVALQRALWHRFAEGINQNKEDYFRELRIGVADESALAASKPFSSQFLHQQHTKMDLTEQSNELLLDPNIGIYNDTGFVTLPATDDRLFVIHLSMEGTKWKNNQGHLEGNYLYRLVGQEFGNLTGDAAKWGGDFVTYVKSPEEAERIQRELHAAVRDRLREENPELEIGGLDISFGLAKVGDDVRASIDEAKKKNTGFKQQEEDAGRRAVRGTRPFGIPVENPEQLKLPQDDVSLRELPEELLAAVEGMTPQERFEQAYLSDAITDEDGQPLMLNARGFFATPHRKYTGAFDMTGLGAVNLKGRAYVDGELLEGTDLGDWLIKKLGRYAMLAGGSYLEVAHLSGDEFAVKSDSREAIQLFYDILAELAENITFKKAIVDPEKPWRKVRGLRFIGGIGEGKTKREAYDAADKEANRAKTADEEYEIANPDDVAGEGLPSRTARRDRARNRGEDGDGAERAALAGGFRPQGFPGTRKRVGRSADEARRARRRVAVKAYQLRRQAFMTSDPKQLAQALLKVEEELTAQEKLEREAVERMAENAFSAQAVVALPKSMETQTSAWKQIISALSEHGDLLPTEPKDAEYTRWKSNPDRYDRPEPSTEAILEDLQKVMPEGAPPLIGIQHAFDLLTEEALRKNSQGVPFKSGKFVGVFKKTGEEALHVMQNAIDTMRNASVDTQDLLANMSLPPAIVERFMEQQAHEQQALDQLRSEQGFEELQEPDLEFDPDVLESDDATYFYQPGQREQDRLRYQDDEDVPLPEGLQQEFDELITDLGEHYEGDEVRAGFRQAMLDSYKPGRSLARELNRQGFVDIHPDLQRRARDFVEQNAEIFDPDPRRRARGWTAMVQQGSIRAFQIFLSGKADMSTLLHEQAHVYFEMVTELAQDGRATGRLTADVKRMLSWLGVRQSEFREKGIEAITDEHRELYARAFEAYVREGKAPSLKLAVPFAQFGRYLNTIYTTIEDLNLHRELTDEVRSVFDRMLASDIEIKNMHQATGTARPVYRTMADAGIMDLERWRAYVDASADFYAEAKLKMRARLAEAEVKAAKLYQTDQFRKMKAAAQEEWDTRLDVQSDAYIRVGRQRHPSGLVTQDNRLGKLDREVVERMLGEGHPLIKKLERARRFAKKNGEHPDMIAVSMGYEDQPGVGLRMLNEIAALPKEKKWVQQRAEEMMLAEHPDLERELNDLQAAAEEAVQTADQFEMLISEYGMDGEALDPDEKALIRRAIDEASMRFVRGLTLDNLRQDVSRRRQARSANKALEASLKGQYRRMRDFKHQEMLEGKIWTRLGEAIDIRSQLLNQLTLFRSLNRRRKLGKAGRMYIDVADGILAALDLSVREVGFTSLGTHAALGMLEAERGLAFERTILADVLDNPPEGGWRKLTVEQATEVLAALKQLYKAAAEIDQVDREGEKQELEELVATIEDETVALKRVNQVEVLNEKEDFLMKFQGMFSSLREPRSLIEELGPTAFDVLWVNGYRKSLFHEEEINKEVLEQVRQAWDEMPKELRDSRFNEDLVGVEMLPMPNEWKGAYTFNYNRQWMWMVALNMGSASNRMRLLGGYRWSEDAVLQFLKANLTEAEKQFIQSIWDMFDKTLFPLVSKEHTRATGLPIDKVEAVPVLDMRGGYFPAKYDPVAGGVAADRQESDHLNLFRDDEGRKSVRNGFTKPRAKIFSDVINLDWNFVPSHVMSVTHYVAFNEYVQKAAKIIENPVFKRNMVAKLGLSKYNQLRDPQEGFLRAVATGPNKSGVATSGMKRFLGAMKSRMMMASIAWSVPVYMAGQANAFIAASKGGIDPFTVLKVWTQAQATGSFLGHDALVDLVDSKLGFMAPQWGYVQMRKTALAKSKLLQFRKEHNARELKRQLDMIGHKEEILNEKDLRALGKRLGISDENLSRLQSLNRGSERFRAGLEETAFVLLDMEDRTSSTIIWTAAYDTYLQEHGSLGLPASTLEEQAIEFADNKVEETMPVADFAAKPAFLRTDLAGALVVFYGFFNKMYNMEAELFNKVAGAWINIEDTGGAWKAAKVTSVAFAQMALVMGFAQLMGEFLSARGPEEEEDLLTWFMRKSAAAPFMLFPVIGGLAEGAVNFAFSDTYTQPLNVRSAPGLAAFERGARFYKDAVAEGTTEVDRNIAYVRALGLVTRTPLASPQVKRFGEFYEAGPSVSVESLDQGLYGERYRGAASPTSVLDGFFGGR